MEFSPEHEPSIEAPPEPAGTDLRPELTTGELEAGMAETDLPTETDLSTETDLPREMEPRIAGAESRVSEIPLARDPAEDAAQPKKARPQTSGTGIPSNIQSILITVIIAVFVITFVVQAFQIPSESMEDTLLIGDYLLVDKAEYGKPGAWSKLLPYRDVQRGDVIVFRYPVNPELHFVKRVVAVPGDRLHLRGGRVYVNGVLQQEPFAVYKSEFPDAYRDNFPNGANFNSNVLNSNIDPAWGQLMQEFVQRGEITVPPDSYFALGDNRDESLDSRYWGFVPRANILGRPLIIYFSHLAPGEQEEDDTGGKLTRLIATVRHWPGYVRWERAFRIIR